MDDKRVFGLAPQPKGIGDLIRLHPCPPQRELAFGLAPQPNGIGDRIRLPRDGLPEALFGLAPQPKGIGDT